MQHEHRPDWDSLRIHSPTEIEIECLDIFECQAVAIIPIKIKEEDWSTEE